MRAKIHNSTTNFPSLSLSLSLSLPIRFLRFHIYLRREWERKQERPPMNRKAETGKEIWKKCDVPSREQEISQRSKHWVENNLVVAWGTFASWSEFFCKTFGLSRAIWKSVAQTGQCFTEWHFFGSAECTNVFGADSTLGRSYNSMFPIVLNQTSKGWIAETQESQWKQELFPIFKLSAENGIIWRYCLDSR
jgi:hypothetical protein